MHLVKPFEMCRRVPFPPAHYGASLELHGRQTSFYRNLVIVCMLVVEGTDLQLNDFRLVVSDDAKEAEKD